MSGLIWGKSIRLDLGFRESANERGFSEAPRQLKVFRAMALESLSIYLLWKFRELHVTAMLSADGHVAQTFI